MRKRKTHSKISEISVKSGLIRFEVSSLPGLSQSKSKCFLESDSQREPQPQRGRSRGVPAAAAGPQVWLVPFRVSAQVHLSSASRSSTVSAQVLAGVSPFR